MYVYHIHIYFYIQTYICILFICLSNIEFVIIVTPLILIQNHRVHTSFFSLSLLKTNFSISEKPGSHYTSGYLLICWCLEHTLNLFRVANSLHCKKQKNPADLQPTVLYRWLRKHLHEAKFAYLQGTNGWVLKMHIVVESVPLLRGNMFPSPQKVSWGGLPSTSLPKWRPPLSSLMICSSWMSLSWVPELRVHGDYSCAISLESRNYKSFNFVFL